MKRIKEIFEKIQNLPRDKQIIVYGGLGALLIPSVLISGMLGPKGLRVKFLEALFYCVFTAKGLMSAILVYGVFLIIIVFILSQKGLINEVINEDDKGVKFLKDGTYGSGNWMSEEEAAEVFTVGDISKVKEQVYGQFTTRGKKVVAFKPNKFGGNQNTFMLGSPGTGKSFGFARTAIIQAILRGESVVITDPSSELYTDIAEFAKNRGANVKVLNFVNPEYSNAWDCLYECVDPETERLDALRLQEFCDIFMRNTNESKASSQHKEDFWYTSSLNLLQAVVGYLAYHHELDLIIAYKELIVTVCKLLNLNSKFMKGYIGFNPTNKANIVELRNKFKTIAKEAGYTDEEVKQIIEECESYATPFTIEEVYRYILNFGSIEKQREKFMELPFGHPGAIAFMTFDRDALNETVSASSQQGILLRLKLFMDEGIRRITSNKDIFIEEFGRRQTVCFLITPDNSAAMKPLQALFFSFLFKDLSEAYDKRQAECDRLNVKNERLAVNVIMDEAFSNGYISNFAEALSTTRKRKIYVTMIWQTIGQVKQLYGDNIADTLKSCCDILVFLGTADLQTAQYVSAFSGTATVRSRTHKEQATSLFRRTDNVMEISASEDSKPVMTVDDVMAINNEVVVIRRGYQHVLKIKRFGYTEHPVYMTGQLIKSSINLLPKSSRIYKLHASIKDTVTLKELESGRGIEDETKSINQFIAKPITLPQNKYFITIVEDRSISDTEIIEYNDKTITIETSDRNGKENNSNNNRKKEMFMEQKKRK